MISPRARASAWFGSYGEDTRAQVPIALVIADEREALVDGPAVGQFDGSAREDHFQVLLSFVVLTAELLQHARAEVDLGVLGGGPDARA